MASPPTPSLGRAFAWLRAHPLLVASVAALLALRVAAPFALEAWLESEAARRLERVVEVGDVDLDVLEGRVSLEDLRLGSLGGGEPPDGSLAPDEVELGARRIGVNASLLALVTGELRLEDLSVEGLHALRVRDASGSLRPLLPVQAPSNQETPDEPESAIPPLAADRIRVVDASFLYVDLSHPQQRPLELGLAELALRDVSLRDAEVAIGGMTLRAPSLRVVRDFDVAALAADEPSEPAAPEAPAEPLGLRLAEITLSEARLSVLGDAQETQIEGVVSLHAQDVSLEPGARFPLVASLQVGEGSATLAGEATLAPPGFEGALSWQGLPLAKLASAAGSALPVSVSAGTSSGQLGVDWSSGEGKGAGLRLSGDARVRGLAASDDAGLAFGWADLTLAIDSIALDPAGERPPRVEIRSLRLREPSLLLARSPTPPPAASKDLPAEAPPPSEPAHVVIASLEVSGGALDFTDATVSPEHRTRLEEFSVSGSDLRWPERRARSLRIRGKSEDAGGFSIDGSDRDLVLQLSDVGLPAFSPYIADASGYWVDDGRADLEARVRLDGERANIDSKLVLHRLALTTVSPGSFEKEFGVPLDVGLALLRDPSGDIVVPIGLTLEGGKRRVDMGSIVIASLRQALLGALTTPLKGVGLLLGGGDEARGFALAPLAFAPGSAQPAPEDAEKLAGIARLLAAHPGLGLRLSGRVGAQDARGIAEQVLIEQVLADAELPPVDAGFLQKRRLTGVLAQRGRGESGALAGDDAAVLEKWLDSVEVSDAQREAFATARAAAVRDALVRAHGVAEKRLALGEPLEGEPAVVLELAPAGR